MAKPLVRRTAHDHPAGPGKIPPPGGIQPSQPPAAALPPAHVQPPSTPVFIPNEDHGSILAIIEAPQGTSHYDMMANVQKLANIARQDPSVEAFFSGTGGPNFGRMFFHLIPATSATSPSTTSMRVFLQNPPTIRIGGSLTKSLYQFTLLSGDTAALYKAAPELEREMAKLPGLMDVTSDLQIKNPELHVEIDRDKAATLRVTPAGSPPSTPPTINTESS